jgi:hypothetical protein
VRIDDLWEEVKDLPVRFDPTPMAPENLRHPHQVLILKGPVWQMRDSILHEVCYLENAVGYPIKGRKSAGWLSEHPQGVEFLLDVPVRNEVYWQETAKRVLNLPLKRGEKLVATCLVGYEEMGRLQDWWFPDATCYVDMGPDGLLVNIYERD